MINPDVALTIESFTPDEEHAFRIDAPMAVRGILRDIARHGERVALYYGAREGGVIVTVILDLEANGFWLDATRDAGVNQSIVESPGKFFVSAHLQAKVQFPVKQLELQQREGTNQFYLPFPEYLTRLQRRDFFRLYLPPGLLKCQVETHIGQEPLRFAVRDISEGGVALYSERAEDSPLKPGDQIQDCRLILEDGSEIVFDIQVRHSALTRMPSGEELTLIGCRFITLSSRMAMQLQRYITRRQREQLP
ncbi:flagellar brake protein [Ferrovum sp.]|uniref:flagellar brake protein n=1 Tax=Ferrovum sp. TaxID=2609467 RepID=UPI0026109C26|nr:flagellar brake protein [Ferrovum sp.]